MNYTYTYGIIPEGDYMKCVECCLNVNDYSDYYGDKAEAIDAACELATEDGCAVMIHCYDNDGDVVWDHAITIDPEDRDQDGSFRWEDPDVVS